MAPKKYKLHSTSGADGRPPPCAFFATEAGCRQGDSCKFLHEKKQSVIESSSIVEAGSVVSSESEGEVMETEKTVSPFVTEEERKELTGEKKRKKTRRSKSSEDPFASPKAKKAKTADTSTTLPVAKEAVATNQIKKEESAPSPAPTSQIPDFLASLNLPVAPFTMPLDRVKSKDEKVATPKSSTPEVAPPKVPAAEVGLPLPKNSPVGRKWLKFVEKTRQHARYKQNFDYDKWQAQDNENGSGGKSSWIKAKPYGEWCAKLPQAIAMDCEMCETQDPVSGRKNTRALCRVSVVNAETKEVLLDTLVRPAWPVTDYRTWVNGIKAEDLVNVHFTLRHAQAFFMALCSEETVIMGHAVHNDLAAIRMEHTCVVDSALLYECKDSPTATIGLKHLSTAILNKSMPAAHDSVNDTLTALAVLDHYRERNGKVEPVERPKNGNTRAEYATQLFVHRIPAKLCGKEDLSNMFLKHADVKPAAVDDIEFAGAGGHGKTIVRFRTGDHAELAFSSLEGSAEPDPSGRLQKRVFMRNGSYIRVRKMVFEEKPKELKLEEKN